MRLRDTHPDDAFDQRLDGLLHVTFAADQEQGVLEVSGRAAVGVSPAQNHVILPVLVPEP